RSTASTPTRATARRCTTRRSRPTGPAPSTGTRSSTCAPLWEARPPWSTMTITGTGKAGRETSRRTWEEFNSERRGSREVRDRDGAHPLQGVPGHRVPVLLRGGDRAPLLPGELRGRGRAQRGRRDLLRGPDVRRLGVGHVPPGSLREERPGADVQGRERRGARQAGPAAAGRRAVRLLMRRGR